MLTLPSLSTHFIYWYIYFHILFFILIIYFHFLKMLSGYLFIANTFSSMLSLITMLTFKLTYCFNIFIWVVYVFTVLTFFHVGCGP